MNKTLFRRVLVATALCALSQSASAVVFWTDWTAAVVGNAGSAAGTLTAGPWSTSIAYAGDVAGPTQVAGGTNYWGAHAAYTGVVNAPSNNDMIAIDSASAVNTLTFSNAVLNPYMAFISVGQGGIGVQYDFGNAPFDVIDSGAGHFGSGPLVELAGDILQGNEGHGIIQFFGTFTSISWSVNPAEFWHGFTVGIEAVVPEPGSLALMLVGLAGLSSRLRRPR